MSAKIKLLVSTTVLLLGFLVSPFFAFPVHAQSGVVCVEPSSTTSCPPPTVLSGPVNTQLRVAVNIQNSPTFTAFDIAVKTDPSVLNPVSFDTTGYVFTGFTVFIFSSCINGSGMGCKPGVDGPGVAHLAIASNGFTPTPTTGRLFAINYNIVAASMGTTVGYSTGCTMTSNDGSCVSIVNGTIGQTVPESLQTATFSNSDFKISANPTTLNIVQGNSGTSTITLTSVGGFKGKVTLSIVLSPAVKHAPQTSLSASTINLKSGGSDDSTLTVSSDGATTLGSYTITLSATSPSGTLSLVISVTVLAK